MAVAARELGYAPETSEFEIRRRLMRRWQELDSIYSESWVNTHQNINDAMCPNRGEFSAFNANRGDRRDTEIVNNTAGEAGSKLAAAMDTGITSEAREWFTLSPEDPIDSENDGVREYCHTVQSILFALIARAGFYSPNRNLLEDLIYFAIGLMLIEEDPINVFRCRHVPVGRYRVGANAQGQVNTVAQQYTLTAQQMVAEFGEERVSVNCRNALGNDKLQTPFRVLHIIEERTRREYGKIDARNKPWRSCWLEIGMGAWSAATFGSGDYNVDGPSGSSLLLRESGYDEQPFICPRWNSIGEDAYGKDSPGWKTLGDTNGLQSLEQGGAKAIAKIIDPPMNQPAALANASLLPGALNPLPDNSTAKFEPAIRIEPMTIKVLGDEKRAYEQRIDRGFYGDVLFLLSRDDSVQPKTAEEIRGKMQERLLQLGGVFARYADEALKKFIARVFAMAQRAGRFPPPPPELLKSGKLRIDFQNPLVTAQKTIGFTAMQQLVSFGIGVAQAKVAGVDKLDGDEAMDTAAEMLGVKPNLLLSDDELAKRRAAAQQQQQAAATGAAMTQAAPAIKDLSNSDPEKLRQLVQQFGPAAAAQATA
jgi:hypothetical protein